MNLERKKILDLKKMTMIGMLSGISIFLGLTGLGFIPLGFMKATIMHIPVIIGAIIGGPVVGASVGLFFGLFSIYQNITAPTLMSPFFMNPLVSVLPRVLIGIISYYVYKLIKNKFKKTALSYGIAAFAGTLTNTIGVLGMTSILFASQYANIKGVSISYLPMALATVVCTQSVFEAIIAVVITVPVVTAIKKVATK